MRFFISFHIVTVSVIRFLNALDALDALDAFGQPKHVSTPPLTNH